MAPEAAAKVLSATLMLRSADGRDCFLGSGFVMGAANRVVTNAHVIGKAAQVTVVTQGGARVIATVTAVDLQSYLAVLRMASPHDTDLQPAQAAVVGQGVFATGDPLEAAFTLTQGSCRCWPVISTRRSLWAICSVLRRSVQAAVVGRWWMGRVMFGA